MIKLKVSDINSYLSFKLGEEEFAVNAGRVLSILEMIKITEVPQSPSFMKGIINLRGRVLPVIDISMKLGMQPTVFTSNTCIIVMEVEMDNTSARLGVIVDSVQAVLEVEKEKVLDAPKIGSRYKAEFLEGIIQQGDGFVMLFDIDKVFSSMEIVALTQSTPTTLVEQLSDK